MDLFRDRIRQLRWRGAEILLGTSGYSFPDWKGTFYPKGIDSRRMLEYYAGHYGAVEINSTYYRIMSRTAAAGMVSKTPRNFIFTVKLHSGMTHSRSAGVNEWKSFMEMLEPFRFEERLGAVLAQFPWSFRQSDANQEYLDEIGRKCGDLPLAVEFRHDSWYRNDALGRIAASGINLVSVDLPELDHLPDRRPVPVSDFGYIRFHGRNREQWWEGGQLRYDYMYSKRELKSWFPVIEKLTGQVGKVFMFFNNCHMGKAAMSADFMKSLLKGE